jgi:hypothetical protein
MIFSHEFHKYLQVLGLNQNVAHDAEAVKKAYCKAAMKTHPDKHPGEEAVWEPRFKEVGTANEKLNEELESPTKSVCMFCGGDHKSTDCPAWFSSAGAGPHCPPAGPPPYRRKPRPRPPIPTCTYCHKKGHQEHECWNKKRDMRREKNTCDTCRAAGRAWEHRPEKCFHIHPCTICGKTGHPEHACRYKGMPKCSHCGDFGHTRTRCFKLHPELAPTCGRCGQKGHTTNRCYQSL